MFLKTYKNFKFYLINSSKENNAILNHMRKYFNESDPFIRHKVSQGQIEDVNQSDADFIEGLKDNLSIKVIAPDGDLAAVSISGFLYKNDNIFDKSKFRYPLSIAAIEMFEEGMKEADLFNRCKTDRLFNSYVGVVATKYRGNKLGMQLLIEKEKLAKETGCKAIFAHCVSPFSSKSFNDLNWSLGKVVDYNEYFGKKGKDFFTWDPAYGKYEFRYKIFDE